MENSVLNRTDWEDYLVQLYFGNSDFLESCINRAYRDFNRTLHGLSEVENKNNLHNDAKLVLKKSLSDLRNNTKEIDQKAFDSWHKTTCNLLAIIYAKYEYKNFYVGQAQKWINMTLKYVFTMGEERIPGFEKIYEFCHIPIDNILLEELEEYKPPTLSCAWSRLKDYEEYFKFQLWVREKFNLTPLDVEFKVWRGEKIYNKINTTKHCKVVTVSDFE